MLDGVTLTALKQVYNSKGDIFHVMRKSDNGFDGFGEAYFSTIKKETIKGWKKHTEMTLNIVVPFGEIEFIIYDENIKKFFSVSLSQMNYQRLTVRPGLWVAFRGLKEYNILLNLASIEHDSNESENVIISDINYDW